MRVGSYASKAKETDSWQQVHRRLIASTDVTGKDTLCNFIQIVDKVK